MPPIPRAGFRTGLASAIPIALGYFPIAFSFGVAATRAGLTPIEATFLSLVIYAGASQFLALVLLTSGASLVISALTLMAMNLRHLVYGPSLLKQAGDDASTKTVAGWGFWLTDETFAAALGGLARGRVRFSEPYMFGIGFGAYAAWVSGTAVGAFAGNAALDAYPAVSAGLGFMLAALFLSLLLSILTRAQVPVIGVAVVVTILGTVFVSGTTGILGGILIGSLAGVIRGQKNGG